MSFRRWSMWPRRAKERFWCTKYDLISQLYGSIPMANISWQNWKNISWKTTLTLVPLVPLPPCDFHPTATKMVWYCTETFLPIMAWPVVGDMLLLPQSVEVSPAASLVNMVTNNGNYLVLAQHNTQQPFQQNTYNNWQLSESGICLNHLKTKLTTLERSCLLKASFAIAIVIILSRYNICLYPHNFVGPKFWQCCDRCFSLSPFFRQAFMDQTLKIILYIF